VRPAFFAGLGLGAALLLGTTLVVRHEVAAAAERVTTGAPAAQTAVATADDAEAPYCTPEFKAVLERVLHACGLAGARERRGCQPADIKNLAAIDDADFNALFAPLEQRGAVVLFDDGSEKLDTAGQKLVEEAWLDRRGARYFFVVARASRTGTPEFNRALSHKRANSVVFLLKDKFKDPDLDKEVGTLWLGNEYAQMSPEYCSWKLSRDAKKCSGEAINRSAFVSWVDCRL
jgi:outer membrane protein OmpA-like peptidoglycan-associated protein